MPDARRYRVLQITSTAAIGGAEQVALELARGCDPDRFEMRVASLGGPPLLTEACRRAAPPIPAWHWNVPPWRLDRIARFLREQHRLGLDLVHTYGLRADLAARLLRPLIGRARLLCAIHSTDAWRERGKVLLDRWTAGAADGFVSVSLVGRDLRIRRECLRADRIAWIPNGIRVDRDDLADRNAVRRSLGIAADAFPVIAHVANLRPMKGHDDLMAAVPEVLRAFPEAVFLLAGRDESGGCYAARVREAGLDGTIRLLGFYPNGREIIRAADIFILPSHYEGCPISILEAMAERRPIVATRVGGIPEQVRHEKEALLIEPGEPAALAGAIVRLAGDESLRRRLAEAARLRVEREFSHERMIERYSRLYIDLIEGRGIGEALDPGPAVTSC